MGSILHDATPGSDPSPPPLKVLIAGACYAGLSAALNLQDLCTGRKPRCGGRTAGDVWTPSPDIAVEITLVDERDGFCKTD